MSWGVGHKATAQISICRPSGRRLHSQGAAGQGVMRMLHLRCRQPHRRGAEKLMCARLGKLLPHAQLHVGCEDGVARAWLLPHVRQDVGRIRKLRHPLGRSAASKSKSAAGLGMQAPCKCLDEQPLLQNPPGSGCHGVTRTRVHLAKSTDKQVTAAAELLLL